MSAVIIFWTSIFLLAYTYVGYPMVAWLRARLQRQRIQTADIEPQVSILCIGHNEGARIGARIDNLLELDYPRDRLEIVVASDGSSDDMVEIAKHYELAGVRVLEFLTQRGKPAVLNEVIPQLRGEIAVLMDVRQHVEQQALRALTANFADPRTGAVSGELYLDQGATDTEAGEGVGFYWRYEKFIRLHESKADSTVGATGALYALRQHLFHPIPENTLLDDVLIPMYVARRGYRVLFEPKARAYDRVSATAQAELTRKVRTIAGNFQLLFHERWLLNPRANRLWFQTLSHKFCRVFGPLFLLAAFISNLFLLDQGFYRVLLLLQVLFYAAAAAGHLSRNATGRPALMHIAYTFCLLNWATVLGFHRFILGRQQVTWRKAQG